MLAIHIGEVGYSLSDFFRDFFADTYDLVEFIFLSELFGVPLWIIYLSFLVISFIVGFIVQNAVSVGFGNAITGISSRSEARAKQAQHDRYASMKTTRSKMDEINNEWGIK
jgi:hypothetical protein